MNGLLHLFRRRVVNGGEFYQVNFSNAGSTFAKVVETPEELEELLLLHLGLARTAVESLLSELARAGTAAIDGVELAPQQAAALGMIHADIDY